MRAGGDRKNVGIVQYLQSLLLIQVPIKGVVHMLLKCFLFVFEKVGVLVLDTTIKSGLFRMSEPELVVRDSVLIP